MPIAQTIFVQGTVGRGGRNSPPDVKAVQQQLNAMMRPPRQKLMVDGRSGPKTEAMIRDFQTVVLKFNNPDGRVDPNGKTLAALNNPQSESAWARMSIAPMPAAQPAQPAGGNPGGASAPVAPPTLTVQEKTTFETVVSRVQSNPAIPPEKRSALFEFLDYAVKNQIKDAKVLLNAGGLLQTSIEAGRLPQLASGIHVMRQVNFGNWQATAEMLAKFSKDKGGQGALKTLVALGENGRAASVFKSMGRVAIGLAVVFCAVEVTDHIAAGRYGPAAGEIYKLGMGLAVPWAGLLNAVQTFATDMHPSFKHNKKFDQLFQMLKHCDPLAAGAVYMDTYVTVIEGVIKLDLTQSRFQELVTRMEKSPLEVYTKMGQSLGDWLGDLYGDWLYENILK